MKEIKLLKNLEEIIRSAEIRISHYLRINEIFRMTDDSDIKFKVLRKKAKSNKTLKRVLHYQYYLGKWAAYQFILGWLEENWHKKEYIKEHKDIKKKLDKTLKKKKFLGLF